MSTTHAPIESAATHVCFDQTHLAHRYFVDRRVETADHQDIIRVLITDGARTAHFASRASSHRWSEVEALREIMILNVGTMNVLDGLFEPRKRTTSQARCR